MSFPLRLSSHAWIIALLGACVFLIWLNAARVQRVEYVSGLAAEAATVDAASPTGYTAGLRRLIVPEHNNDSYQWIAQTQQMLARREWHVRHVDYDNAPFGRDVRSPSPYRWWLGLIAWLDHAASGRPLGLAVERAALLADPGLHLLLLVGAALFIARQFGRFPAALWCVGAAAAFPFGGAFLPGQPNDSGLAQACALGSVLPLLAGICARRPAELRSAGKAPAGRRTRRWFLVAGLAGGIGLWINVARQGPILAGIALGGIIMAWLTRATRSRDAAATAEVAPWRVWALGGAGTCLAATLIEYFPGHMGGLRLETVHPLYGLGWLGAGEVLARASAWGQRAAPAWNARRLASFVLAVLAVALVPGLMGLTGGGGIMASDALASRLTNLPDSAVAQNLWAWIHRDGFTTMTAATCLPLLLLAPAGWLLARRTVDADHRAAIALALGPVLVALGLALLHLSWWSMLDTALLALLVAVTAAISSTVNPRLGRWLATGTIALILTPAVMLLVAQARADSGEVVTESDVVALVERDLAYWLANQTGADGAVVLAPPNLTTSLYFHGGLAGLATPYWDNKDGFAAAVRIAGATSPDEAQAVARGRGLTHVIVPSWDAFLDEFARLGSGRAEHSLIALLHHWLPPLWLRPVPYHLPKIPGFDGQSVVIFEVVDIQDNVTALSRLAEYFVEMGRLDQAASVSQSLERYFPAELGATVARTLVDRARGDAAGFAKALQELQSFLARGDDRTLAWDRRVSLAIALVEGKQFDPAREQVRRCLAELDEPRLRSLTTVSLYRLQLMGKGFGLQIADQKLRELARGLLPGELRANL